MEFMGLNMSWNWYFDYQVERNT